MPLLIDSLDSILHGVFLQKPQTIVDQVYDAIQLEVQNDKEIKKLAYSRYITFYMENRRVGRLAGSYVGKDSPKCVWLERGEVVTV